MEHDKLLECLRSTSREDGFVAPTRTKKVESKGATNKVTEAIEPEVGNTDKVGNTNDKADGVGVVQSTAHQGPDGTTTVTSLDKSPKFEASDDDEFIDEFDFEAPSKEDAGVAVIDTDLADGTEEEGAKAVDYVGKHVVVCPVCLSPMFSDKPKGTIYCPVCDKDVEVAEPIGKVTEPNEDAVDATDGSLTDDDLDSDASSGDPSSNEDDFIDEGKFKKESTEFKDDSRDPAVGNTKKTPAPPKTDKLGVAVKESANPEPGNTEKAPMDNKSDDLGVTLKEDMEPAPMDNKADKIGVVDKTKVSGPDGTTTITDVSPNNDYKTEGVVLESKYTVEYEYSKDNKEYKDTLEISASSEGEAISKAKDQAKKKRGNVVSGFKVKNDKQEGKAPESSTPYTEYTPDQLDPVFTGGDAANILKDYKAGKITDKQMRHFVGQAESLRKSISEAKKFESTTVTVDQGGNAAITVDSDLPTPTSTGVGAGLLVSVDDFDTDSFDGEVNDVISDIYDDEDANYESVGVYREGKGLVVEGKIKSGKNEAKVKFTCTESRANACIFKAEGLKGLVGRLVVGTSFSESKRRMETTSMKYKFLTKMEGKAKILTNIKKG